MNENKFATVFDRHMAYVDRAVTRPAAPWSWSMETRSSKVHSLVRAKP